MKLRQDLSVEFDRALLTKVVMYGMTSVAQEMFEVGEWGVSFQGAGRMTQRTSSETADTTVASTVNISAFDVVWVLDARLIVLTVHDNKPGSYGVFLLFEYSDDEQPRVAAVYENEDDDAGLDMLRAAIDVVEAQGQKI